MLLLCFLKILYADDTCVLMSGNHLNSINYRLNTELISLNNWFKDDQLDSLKKSAFCLKTPYFNNK